MKKLIKIATLSIMIGCLLSCSHQEKVSGDQINKSNSGSGNFSKVPLTKKMLDENKIPIDFLIGKVNVFLSAPVSINLTKFSKGFSSEDGVLLVEKNAQPEQGNFPKGISGIIVDANKNSIFVRFQQGGINRYLEFRSTDGQFFYLYGTSLPNGGLSINYDNQKWEATPDSRKAFLEISFQEIMKSFSKKWAAEGVSVSNVETETEIPSSSEGVSYDQGRNSSNNSAGCQQKTSKDKNRRFNVKNCLWEKRNPATMGWVTDENQQD